MKAVAAVEAAEVARSVSEMEAAAGVVRTGVEVGEAARNAARVLAEALVASDRYAADEGGVEVLEAVHRNDALVVYDTCWA